MTTVHSPIEEFYITMPELPSQVEVEQYVANTPSSNGDGQTDPWWAVLCVMLGSFLLVGAGAFLIAVGVSS